MNHMVSFKRKAWAISLFFLILFLAGALLTCHPDDFEYIKGGLRSGSGFHNIFGLMGALVSRVLFLFLGLGAYCLLIQIILIFFRLWINTPKESEGINYYIASHFFLILGALLLLGVFPNFCQGYTQFLNISHLPGGIVGGFLSDPQGGIIYTLANRYGCVIVSLLLLSLCGYYIWLFDWSHAEERHDENKEDLAKKSPESSPKQPTFLEEPLAKTTEPTSVKKSKWQAFCALFKGKNGAQKGEQEEKEKFGITRGYSRGRTSDTENPEYSNTQNVTYQTSKEQGLMLKGRTESEAAKIEKTPPKKESITPTTADASLLPPVINTSELPPAPQAQKVIFDKQSVAGDGCYHLPTLDLLATPTTTVVFGADTEEIENNKQALREIFTSFKIPVTIGNACSGPRITLYEVIPEEGVRVERISSLQNNIAMKLCVASLRILAPIPGKGSVGIEVPNRKPVNVLFHEVISSEEWQKNSGHIPLILGRGIDGRVVITDLTKAPHLLIAGATGTGKSVCINALLMSMLFKFSPEELRLILVDPKAVEFTPYHQIPHLIVPVITENEKVPKALRWAVNEMERRYRLLSKVGVRNLDSFNSRVYDPTILDDAGQPLPQKLPFIVIVVDELADIMMTSAKNEVENLLARLAQKSRAIGIHTILATQRPSVNVITGVIKANFPARIAFKVASPVDSQTILNRKGAESLLGMGDSLFQSSSALNLERTQGAFVSDREVLNVTGFIAVQGQQQFDESVFASSDDKDGDLGGRLGGGSGKEDDLINQAIEIIRREKKASISHLQRRLGIGYPKAANVMDELESMGVVGSQRSGVGQREILLDDLDD